MSNVSARPADATPPAAIPGRCPEAWKPEELQAVLATAAKRGGSYFGTPRRLWWLAFIRLTVDTRLSRYHLMRIRGRDISPAGVLTVALPDRAFSWQLSPETVAAVEALAVEDNERLFGQAGFCVRVLWGFKGILRRAGLKSSNLWLPSSEFAV